MTVVHDWYLPFWRDDENFYIAKALLIVGFFFYLRYYSASKVRMFYAKVCGITEIRVSIFFLLTKLIYVRSAKTSFVYVCREFFRMQK